MTPATVSRQLREVYQRLIGSSLSVMQHYPSEVNSGARTTIGALGGGAIALRDIPYQDVYSELDGNNSFHIKLPDGGLLIFQYTFEGGALVKHRLAYFPSPILPTMDEAPFLYENDELFGDIIVDRLVRFPIRFDFDPGNHRDLSHPKSHLTLGQFSDCRIPVTAPVSPNAFVVFVLRNFYARAYRRNMNRFRKSIAAGKIDDTITLAERGITHLVCR